jgi:hypothetical protein
VSTVNTSSTPPVLARRVTPACRPGRRTGDAGHRHVPVHNGQYNGNPNRNDRDTPMALADASAYAVARGRASRGGRRRRDVALPAPDRGGWTPLRPGVAVAEIDVLRDHGPSAAAWDALKQTYGRRRQAHATARRSNRSWIA